MDIKFGYSKRRNGQEEEVGGGFGGKGKYESQVKSQRVIRKRRRRRERELMNNYEQILFTSKWKRTKEGEETGDKVVN